MNINKLKNKFFNQMKFAKNYRLLHGLELEETPKYYLRQTILIELLILLKTNQKI